MTDLTLGELAAAIAARKVSALEATDACLERIARLDRRLRAFITLDADGARARARTLDADLAAGRRRGPLHGVPLAYKDLCHVAGLPTSCGTRTRDYCQLHCTGMPAISPRQLRSSISYPRAFMQLARRKGCTSGPAMRASSTQAV